MNSRLHEGLSHESAVRVLIESGKSPYRLPRILACNHRVKGGELDVVLEETCGVGRVCLVFLEIRARLKIGQVSGFESVGLQKRLRVEKAARYFLAGYRGRAEETRFDVCSVELDERSVISGVSWYQGAW